LLELCFYLLLRYHAFLVPNIGAWAIRRILQSKERVRLEFVWEKELFDPIVMHRWLIWSLGVGACCWLGAAGSFPGMCGMLVAWSSLSFSMEFYSHRGRLLLCRLPCKLSVCLQNSSSNQTSSSILLIFIFFVRLAKLLACNVVGI
jgi:hypothetical protein